MILFCWVSAQSSGKYFLDCAPRLGFRWYVASGKTYLRGEKMQNIKIYFKEKYTYDDIMRLRNGTCVTIPMTKIKKVFIDDEGTHIPNEAKIIVIFSLRMGPGEILSRCIFVDRENNWNAGFSTYPLSMDAVEEITITHPDGRTLYTTRTLDNTASLSS